MSVPMSLPTTPSAPLDLIARVVLEPGSITVLENSRFYPGE